MTEVEPSGLITKDGLGLDFDGTMVNTIGPLALWTRSTYGRKFTKHQFLNENPDPELDLDYFAARRVFMKDSSRIPHLRFWSGVVESMPLLKRNFSAIHIISSRWTDENPKDNQEPYMRELLAKHYISMFITSILLRRVGEERKWEVKLEHARNAGVGYMVEDDAKIAVPLSKHLKGVVLIRRPWNKHEPHDPVFNLANRENLIICRSLGDFAVGVDIYGGVERFFAAHAESLQDSKDESLYAVYEAPISPETRLIIASSRGPLVQSLNN